MHIYISVKRPTEAQPVSTCLGVKHLSLYLSIYLSISV